MLPTDRDKLIKDLTRHLNSFGVYNRSKIELSLSIFSEQQAVAFQLIPYLLHCHTPQKFSDINGGLAPSGIYSYRQPQGLQALCKKYFGQAEKYDLRSTHKNPPIEFLSIMGSVGSIAYTDKSDLDYWCCLREDLCQKEINLLQLKFKKIEKWCEKELNTEVHFFITNSTLLKENNFGEVSTESCGSALGKLLKEEYYRGSLHINGKIPLWWIIPHGSSENTYHDISNFIENNSTLLPEMTIDIGNLIDIPQEEFLGGGLWQLNKGIHSPFKSIIKLALLIAYADSDKSQTLLSESLRRTIQTDTTKSLKSDPYCEMIDFILNYYENKNDFLSIQFLQICFYSKVKQPVSAWIEREKEPENPHYKTMLNYVKKWNWSKNDTEVWEDLGSASLRESIKLKQDLEKFMLEGFQILVENVQKYNIKSIVSETDLERLLNRILTIYDPTRSRTEWLYPPFNQGAISKAYTFAHTSSGKWRLFKGEVNLKEKITSLEEKNHLRSSDQIEDLCLWLIYNNFLQHKTKIFINISKVDDFSHNLKVLSGIYKQHFGSPRVPNLDEGGFHTEPSKNAWLISINLVPGQDIYYPDPVTESTIVNEQNLFKRSDENIQSDTPKSNKVKTILETIRSSKDDEEPTTHLTVITDISKEGEKKRSLGSHEDPFNATIEKVNLAKSIMLISRNDWGEISHSLFKSKDNLINAILYFLENSKNLDLNFEQFLGFHIGQCNIDPRQYYKRLKDLFSQIISFFSRDNVDIQITKFFFIELGGEIYLIQHERKNFSYHIFKSLTQASIFINVEYPKNTNIAFDQNNKEWQLYQKALERHKLGEVHCSFQQKLHTTNFILIDEKKHFVHYQISPDELRQVFPRFIKSVLTSCDIIHNLEDKDSIYQIVKINSYSKGAFQDCTKQTIEVLSPALKRLKEIDLQIPFENGLELLKTFAEKGRYIFNSDVLKNEVKYGLREIYKYRTGLENDKDYPVYFNHLKLITGENSEQKQLNTALVLNLKLALEKACQLVFINSKKK